MGIIDSLKKIFSGSQEQAQDNVAPATDNTPAEASAVETPAENAGEGDQA